MTGLWHRDIGIVTFLLCVSCATGSTRHSMKIVSAGKSVSLNCVVPKDPNVNIYWRRGSQSTLIAYAGRLNKTGYIYPDFNNNRITMNFSESWNATASVFTIKIWNISAEDSSCYKCDKQLPKPWFSHCVLI